MAVGLDNTLQIAKSSLFTNQYRINVIGQNIANADNVNYSRKVVVAETANSIKEISPGSIGTGVNVREVKRIIDKFLEINISRNESQLGRYEIANKYLNNVASIFNDLKNSGLSDRLNQFWNSWFDLANNPSGSAERIAVIEKAVNLSKNFYNVFTSLEEQQRNINSEISNIIDEINDITKKIAKLNQDIYSIEINPNNHANDLRDKRDTLVKELAKYIDINYIEENRQYVIYTANGKTLVNGAFAYNLKAVNNENKGNLFDIYWIDSQGNPENITDELKGGELKGLVEVRDEYIQNYKDRISRIANSLITEVNKVHSKGVGLDTYKEIIGNVRIENSELPFNYAGLANEVNKGHFNVIVYNSSGTPVEFKDIVIGNPEANNLTTDTDINNLEELKVAINNINHITATIVDNKLKIVAESGFSFAFANDTSGVLAGLGINTFFTGDKYDLNPSVNVMGSEDSGNTVHLEYVGVTNKIDLTGHEYKIEYDGSNITITDLTKGEVLGSDRYTVETVGGKPVIKFDGIKVQLDNVPSTTNYYYINNIPSVSVYNDDKMDNHIYQIDFTQGDGLISVTDLTENRTLVENSEVEIKDIDVDGDSVIDYKTINIKKAGLTLTIKPDTFGIIEINPKNVGAKYINSALNEEDIKYLNAGKVNSIEYDDSGASIKIHDAEITNITALTRKKYTIVADGTGGYQITDEDGISVPVTASGSNFVEFQGIRINFTANTNNEDLYIVNSNLLDFSSGDNRIASEIGNLRDKKVINNDSESITEAYSNLIGKIGVDKNHIQNRLDATKTTNEGLMKQRDSVSGVSIDEEMTKLIQTQHAYVASSKLITVVDKLTQYLLNSV